MRNQHTRYESFIGRFYSHIFIFSERNFVTDCQINDDTSNQYFLKRVYLNILLIQEYNIGVDYMIDE